MQDCYKELRRCIFGTRPELLRFRQIIVNVVLATDIFDRELVRSFDSFARNSSTNSVSLTLIFLFLPGCLERLAKSSLEQGFF